MEYSLVGFPGDSPTLELDHESFAYAGKFVMTSTGKAVACEDDSIVGAVAFNEDHSDEDRMRIRYVTVRERNRGRGIGPRLLRFTAHRLDLRHDSIGIAVNNPIAYQAAYRAGFVTTGHETGIAELLLEYRPESERSTEQYRQGFSVFADRELPEEHRDVIEKYGNGTPPRVVALPR